MVEDDKSESEPLDELDTEGFTDYDKNTVITPTGSTGFTPPDGAGSVDASHDPLLNTRIGNLEIRSVLGEGGFGKVYKARDTSLDRDVAIKVLHEPLNPRSRSLFEREAKALAVLDKQASIVRIYQWGQYTGRDYFVLEYVEGNARELIEEYPSGLPVPMALRIAAECCEALQAAHKKGILHRDIKPTNILIESENGRAKLADFGLARLRMSDDSTVGGRGAISGSPPYMSPEQAHGEGVDERSDVFSLGVTLYEFLSGKRPFEGNSSSEVLERVCRDERVPFRTRRPDLPDGICVLVDKATAHKPEERFQSAGEFARALRIALQSLERMGQVPHTPTPRKRFIVKAAGVLLAAVLAVLLIVLAGRLATDHGRQPAPGTALAAATDRMNEADFAGARELYRRLLDTQPPSDEVLYGLGWACLLTGDLDTASDAFGRIRDEALRREVEAGFAFESDEGETSEAIERTRSGQRTPYLDVVLAKGDALNERYDRVVERLGKLTSRQFPFDWQHAEALQLLGQAYYHLGEYARSMEAFEQLEDSRLPGKAAIARAYVTSAAQELDRERREEVRESARRIRELLDNGVVETTPSDSWTSRPLTFFVLPVDALRSRCALESGLADLLPLLLGDRLDLNTPMNLVERDLIVDILAEQELAALVGATSGQLALGQVLGSRLILSCAFSKLGKQDKLTAKVVDVETTERIPVESVGITPRLNPEKTVDSVGEAIWAAINEAYPLRGRIYRHGQDAEINVGSSVGVAADMQFDVFVDPEVEPLPDAGASVHGAVGLRAAKVEVSGIDVAQLPDSAESGWYVQVR